MRLINTKTFKLEQFPDDSTPPYAILSHTWGDDSEELTFRDVEDGIIDKPAVARSEEVDMDIDMDGGKSAIGSTKFRGCCRQAVKDGLGYAWIDTCCIDKTNLVELNSAINSMFQWYSRASVCYAYLSDVPGGDDSPKPESKFRTSRWFQRGWTLQELLAPKYVGFYNSEWQCIGTKGIMSKLITDITRVPRQFLLGVTELRFASIAQRMSWASRRTTKRPEDLAYCLLGIFGAVMPLAYGEGGEQAFFRLQEQIMATSRDDSVLAWGLSDGNEKSIDDGINSLLISDEDQIRNGNILATSPRYFKNSGQITPRENIRSQVRTVEMIGSSFRLSLPLLTTASGEIFGLLNCGPGLSPHKAVGIPLAKVSSGEFREFIRPRRHPSVLRTVPTPAPQLKLIYIKKDGQKDAFAKTNKQYWFYEQDLFAQINLELIDTDPSSCWDRQTNLISPINSGDGTTSPIFLRFRRTQAGSQDFVTILEEKQADSGTHPRLNNMICRTVACNRDRPLPEVTQNLRHILTGLSWGKSARSEVLHLRITLESVGGGIMSINPEAIILGSDATIIDSENADFFFELKAIIKERRQILTKDEELKSRSRINGERLKIAREESEEVERQIKELEERRKTLLEEEAENTQEMHYIGEEQAEVDKARDNSSKLLSHAQQRVDSFGSASTTSHQLRTLFQEAIEIGDAAMAEWLFFKVDHMAALKDPWIPLIAASIRGDVDTVQQLFDDPNIQPDLRDTIFDRTALCWASRGGHEAVVRLLLDTGKVYINSRDNSGRTPLRWAIEKSHKSIKELLIVKGGKIYDIISALAFSRDSKLIAAGATDGTIKIWDTAKGQCQRTLQGYDNSQVRSVVFSNESKVVVSGSLDGSIRIWNMATGRCLQVPHGHSDCVLSVALSHDSNLLISGSRDNTIKIWDITSPTCRCQRTLRGHSGDVSWVALSHDSNLLVSGSGDRTVKIWDVTTGRCQQTFEGHTHLITSVAFSHDSGRVVSSDRNNTIKIWDITGRCQQTMQCHNGGNILVAFSPDSKLVMSGAMLENSVQIWDSITGECKRTLRGSDTKVSSMAFSRDFKFIASASKGPVNIWDDSPITAAVDPSPQQRNGDPAK